MSFPRYPAYKDSGVQWIAALPAHWDLRRFKSIFAERIDKSESGDELLLSVSAYTGVTPRSELVDDGDHLSRAESLEGYKRCFKDDLVMNIMLAWNRGLAFTQFEGIVSPAYCVFRVIDDSHPKFLNYLVRSDEYTAYFKAFSSGVIDSRLRIYPETFGALLCALPPTEEQADIANFLDHETAKIDALVAEQERLIELLKEKRQSIISQAVTKGMDPSVPMKDSGVEWLGEVPAHWEVKAIKRLSPVLRGASPRPIEDPKYFDDDGEYAWVRIADASASSGVLTQTTQRLSNLGSSLSVKLEPGQLFVSIAGTVGKPCITGIKACIHDGFVYFPRLAIPAKFLFRIFEAALCYGGLGKMGTQLNLNTETIGAICIAVPPMQELLQVLDYVQKELGKVDDMISTANATVSLLQERRTALISAAVTGQIDVRAVLTPEVMT